MGKDDQQNDTHEVTASVAQSSGLNANIRQAKNAADSFLLEVKAIETDLEKTVLLLESQVGQLEQDKALLDLRISELQEKLKKQPDCNEKDDFSADPASDKELAGEKTQQVSGGGGGKIH